MLDSFTYPHIPAPPPPPSKEEAVQVSMGLDNGKAYFPEDERAAAQFDALVEQLGGPDVLRPQQAIMIRDIVENEQLKEQLRSDIRERGLGRKESNGRQSYWRENKSVALLMKLNEQQRRTLQALGLITRQGGNGQPDTDDGDDFDAF